MKFYTGIGSRETPPAILDLMAAIAANLADTGWTLRSGHADGADWAFEQGASSPDSEIYLPWPSFGIREYRGLPGRAIVGRPICDETAWRANYGRLHTLKIHHNASPAVQLLHGRNYAQVLGRDGDSPTRFVLYYATEVDGVPQGGTATAVKLAQLRNINTINLLNPDNIQKVRDWIAVQPRKPHHAR